MGAGGSTKLPYTSVEDAKKAGKTQAEIDAWLATNRPSKAELKKRLLAAAVGGDTATINAILKASPSMQRKPITKVR